jgi:hypothetical protein
VINKLQETLIQAAKLAQEWHTHFIVDPKDMLSNLLRGSQDLGQIFAAWSTLRKRIVLGLQYFEKYDEQYCTQELPSSPVSTAPKLIEALNNLETDDDRL